MDRVSRRNFLRIAGGTAASAVLAACAPAVSPNPAPSAGTPVAATTAPSLAPTFSVQAANIRFSMFTAPPWEPFIQKYLDGYAKRQDKVKVKFEPFDFGTYFTNLQTGLASGDPPDAFLLVHFNMDKYVKQGAVEPLDDYVKRDNYDLSVFNPTSVNFTRMGGPMYGIGWSIDSSGVFYNKDLFDKMGVAYPPKDGKWDWNDYREKAKAMTTLKSDGSFDTVGTTLWLNMNTDLPVDSLYANGGMQINDNEDFTKTLIGDPKAREAIKFAMDLVLKDKVAQKGDSANTIQWIEQFTSGRYAMHWGFVNSTANFTGTPFTWDMAPLPVSPTTGIRKSSPNPNSYVMAKASKNKDAAWDFLKWLGDGSEENSPQTVWVRDIHQLVPYSALNDKYWLLEKQQKDGFDRSVGLNSLKDHWRYPHFPGYDEWYVALGVELVKVWEGVDEDKAIDNAVAVGDKILKDNPTPKGWVYTG